MDESSHDQTQAAQALQFIRWLSWSLQVIFASLAVFTISKQIAAWSGWFALVGLVLIWLIFFVSAHGLSRRQNWARIASIGVLGWIGLALAWTGGAALLAGIGVLASTGPANASSTYELLLRLGLVAIGLLLLSIAYLCWRLISRLRSSAVRQVFIRV